MRFAHVSVGTNDGHSFDLAVSSLRAEGLDFEFEYFDSTDLDSDPLKLQDAIDYVSGSQFLSMRVHGDTCYFKKFDRLKKAIESYGIDTVLECTDDDVMDNFRYMFKGSDEDHLRCVAYLTLGGDENLGSLIRWAIRSAGADIEVPDPIHPPAQGIYYPGRESIDFESYIDSLDPSKPNIGIFFYQRQWLSGNKGNADGLIRAVEALGANPVPVFMYATESKVAGAIGTKRVLREHLTRDGRPILHAIIETMSFSQVVVTNPGDGGEIEMDNFFQSYGVPVIQSMAANADRERWQGDINGLSPAEIAYDIAHPEFDGQIISTICATTERQENGTYLYEPVEDRAMRVAETAVRWAKLRMKADPDRKVAILLYMYPPKTANAGGASGLDTFQSVVDLLHVMKNSGYRVKGIPETAKELTDMLLAGLTNDSTWISDDSMIRRSVDTVSPGTYETWFKGIGSAGERIVEGWGKPPGDVCTARGCICIPGKVFGNVFVGFQPDRGRDIQSDYHDPLIVMPHQYLAYYRWLKEVFGADAVIHVGTHGTLEWLPGKSVALSDGCCPDYVLDSLPDIYPYIIGNPGEGIQAKRRAAAVIVDHMIPAMVRSGGYDEIDEAEAAVQNYMSALAQGQLDKIELIRVKLRSIVADLELYNDLKMAPDCSDADFDSKVDALYDYITDVKENLIKDGLHILGHVPEGKRLEEMVYSLTRLDNGDVPSMRGSVATAMGLALEPLIEDPSAIDPSTGRLNGELLREVEEATESLISRFAEADFDLRGCTSIASELYPKDNCDLMDCLFFVCHRLVPSIRRMGDEIGSVMAGLRGEYIEPGPSGCPTRGRAQLLPTGKNFYSLDPDSVPWQSSWEIGVRMADQMLERYITEHGGYPRSVGIVVWATDTMKTGGDDIAYILWLMGLRPVWTGYGGKVIDLEVIPVSELGRPRIDVTLRISGLFRDTFPNLVNLIDGGVRRIADLDESDEDNYLRANLREDIVKSMAEGLPEEEAREDALIRIFGDAPGSYGSGTNILIRTADWKDVSDLGGIYRSYGEYAYGLGRKGERRSDAFLRMLSRMDVTVKNSTSREYDMLDNDDVYNDLGGLNAAVRSARGKMPASYIGCSADSKNLKTRTIDEEGRFIFRSKIMNPKWVDGLKEHGFKGAQEISDMAEYVFAWDATSDIIDPWMYQGIADKFLFDEENSQWLREANPYAMYETTAWLLQAIGRGMWEPDDETRESLERLFEELEGQFEGMERWLNNVAGASRTGRGTG